MFLVKTILLVWSFEELGSRQSKSPEICDKVVNYLEIITNI